MSNNNSLTRLTIRSCENITCLQWKWTRRIGWKKTRGGRIKDSSEDSRNGLSGPGPARSSPAGWIYKFPQLFANLRRHYIAIWGTPTWIDRRVISPNIKPRFAISPSFHPPSLRGRNRVWIFSTHRDSLTILSRLGNLETVIIIIIFDSREASSPKFCL